MKTGKRHIGDIGEGIACNYLERKGDRILERNYWKPWGEIDIVAKRQEKLVFVEVKSVSCESVREVGVLEVRPEENMHPAKLQRLHRAIQSYLLDRKIGESTAWQLDLACVYLDQVRKEAKVTLLENIVL